MKRTAANLGLIFGSLGFLGILVVIIAGFFGCCTGLTTATFNYILIGIFAVSFLAFAWCMYNNCCKAGKKNTDLPQG